MSAILDRKANESLATALTDRVDYLVVQERHRVSYLRFLRDARAAGWGWARIGRALGRHESGPRRDWNTHRQVIGRLGDA